jgi:hypothetical protein
MAYNEIRQTLSKKTCRCAECGKLIEQGTNCIIDPKSKKVYCLACGKNKK